MPYAVTCRSCGARFSIGDELYRKRFAGRVITLRCKQCQGPIRLNASETPSKPQQNKRPLPSPPAPPVRPRPALRSVPDDFLDDPEQIVALSPGLMTTTASERVTLPQFSTDNYVDVTDSAKSEPSSSGVPPLAELTHTSSVAHGPSREDTDFLLGLSTTGDPAAASPSPLMPALIFDDDAMAQTPRRGHRADVPAGDSSLFASNAGVPSGRGHQTTAEDDDIDDRVTVPAKKRISPVFWFGLLVCLVAVGAAIRLTRPAENSNYSSSVEAARPAVLTETPALAAQAAPTPELDGQPPAAEGSAATATTADAPTVAAVAPNPARVRRNEPAQQPLARSAELAPAGRDAGSGDDLGEPPTEAAFDKLAATNALSAATTQASACRKPGDPSGMADVTVTFAPSGRVTSATVAGPPFAGTETGGCIASTLRSARVPAFTGDNVTVTKTVVIQ